MKNYVFKDIYRHGLKVTLLAVLLVTLSASTSAQNKTFTESSSNDATQNTVVEIKALGRALQNAEIESKTTNDNLKERNNLLINLAAINPAAFFGAIFNDQERENLAEEIKKNIEENTIKNGVLRAFHVDDFSNPENSQINYYLEVDGKRLDIYSVVPLDQFAVGAYITVRGVGLQDILVAKNIESLEGPLPRLDSVGVQKTAVLLIDFVDSVNKRPFSAKEAQEIIFNSQFQKFYAEQSYGKVSFKGDVFGWFTLPQAATPFYSACGAPDFEDIALIVAQHNIDLTKYDRLLILPSHPNANGGCSSVGKFNLTLNDQNYYLSVSWIGNLLQYNLPSYWGAQPFTWTNLDYLLSHELGHALGVYHANGLDCHNEVAYGDNCSHLEYGNAFDTMGSNSYSLHFNTMFKEALGWLSSLNNISVTKDVKEVLLHPLENGKGNLSIKILLPPEPGSRRGKAAFYLEHRQPIGFDRKLAEPEFVSNQNGIFVNKRPLFSIAPQLLDITPLDGSYWYDGIKNTTLNKGGMFVDRGKGISISVLGPATSSAERESPLSVTVKYSVPECQRFVPRINNAYASNSPIPAGGYGYVSLSFENSDYYGCGAANFTTEITLPVGWSVNQIYPPNNKTLLVPEEVGYSDIYFYIPTGTTPGAYFVEMKVRNTVSGLVSSYPTNIFVTN